jgi:hypothetical protein
MEQGIVFGMGFEVEAVPLAVEHTPLRKTMRLSATA